MFIGEETRTSMRTTNRQQAGCESADGYVRVAGWLVHGVGLLPADNLIRLTNGQSALCETLSLSINCIGFYDVMS